MERRRFLQSIAAGTMAAARPACPSAPPKPNLMILAAGRWPAQALETAGNPDVHLPNLRKLAEGGAAFTRAYAAYPLPDPSRAALLTGHFPHSCGVLHQGGTLPSGMTRLSDPLKRLGYRTGYFGEWRAVDPRPREHGFDESGSRAEDAAAFLGRGEGPFFVFCALALPDPPALKDTRLYSPGDMHLRPNVPVGSANRAAAGYAASYTRFSAADGQIGNLLRLLEERGLARDTIAVFTADCGDLLGSHGLDGADSWYEESAGVPLLVRYPRLLKSGKRGLLVSNVDLMPTLLSLCGAPVPDGVQGTDLSGPILRSGSNRPESIYAEGALGLPGEWRMIVRGLDKLVVDPSLRVLHLYNLGEDPGEMTDL
ncbi:MAG: sulfatase-like hydrolase/transferase, partial [Bryobacteraceae bacterium]